MLCYRRGGGANGPGWDVRVVPNKFPALEVEGTLDRQGEGLFDKMSGVGAHEVIIETPEHGQSLATLPVVAIERVLWAFRERVLDLKQDTRFKSILIFKNHGIAAGASLEHPHSQLIALPIVPRTMRDEVAGARAHFDLKDRCVFCDIVRQEQDSRTRVISENAEFLAVSPYAPRFAFETWLLPKRHGSAFEDAARHEYESLARMLKETLQRMNRALLSPPYNLIIHSAPFRTPGPRAGVPLAPRDHAEADEGGRVRVGDGVLHQSRRRPRRRLRCCGRLSRGEGARPRLRLRAPGCRLVRLGQRAGLRPRGAGPVPCRRREHGCSPQPAA